MTIIVTGCVWFIGTHLTKKLLDLNHKVIGIDTFNNFYDNKRKFHNHEQLTKYKNQFKIENCDVCESKSFMDADVDVIFHLASRANVRNSIQNPLEYIQDNIKPIVYILDCLKKRKEIGMSIPVLIYASSSSVYGSNPIIPFHEDDPLNHIESPYALSKKVSEEYALLYHKLFGIKSIGLRFFTVYGPNGRPDMAPEKFLTNIYLGKEIQKYGNGTSERDYTYIDDIIQGLIKAMDVCECFDCTVINLGNSHTTSLNDFIALCEKVVGKKAIVKQVEKQTGDVPITYANITRAKNLLDYEPETQLEEGLTKTFKWLKGYLDDN